MEEINREENMEEISTEEINAEEINAEKGDTAAKTVVLSIIGVLLVAAIVIIVMMVTAGKKNASSDLADAPILVEDLSDAVADDGEAVSGGSLTGAFAVSLENVDNFITSFGEYKNLSVNVEKEEVTEDMVDYYAEYFFSQEAVAIDGRVAEEGDTVIINYVGTIDGVAFAGGTADGQPLTLGSHSYIDGFEDGLIGAVAGESRDLKLKFPETYGNTDLAGKDCVFAVKVVSVIPKLCDEGVVALNIPEYSNVEEYKVGVKEYLEDVYADEYLDNVLYAVLDQIAQSSEFDIPEALLAEERENVRAAYTETAYSYGLDVDTYFSYMGATLDEVAESYAKQSLIFYKVAKEEGISFADEHEMITLVYDFLVENAIVE